MAYAEPPPGRWRRLLGGPNSWRRIVLSGIGAGLVVAFVAALAASFIGDSESSSLDPVTPTAPGAAPDTGDDVQPPADEPPGDEPPPPPDEPADDQPQPTEPPDQPAPTEPPPPTPPPPTAPQQPTATPPQPTAEGTPTT